MHRILNTHRLSPPPPLSCFLSVCLIVCINYRRAVLRFPRVFFCGNWKDGGMRGKKKRSVDVAWGWRWETSVRLPSSIHPSCVCLPLLCVFPKDLSPTYLTQPLSGWQRVVCVSVCVCICVCTIEQRQGVTLAHPSNWQRYRRDSHRQKYMLRKVGKICRKLSRL